MPIECGMRNAERGMGLLAMTDQPAGASRRFLYDGVSKLAIYKHDAQASVFF